MTDTVASGGLPARLAAAAQLNMSTAPMQLLVYTLPAPAAAAVAAVATSTLLPVKESTALQLLLWPGLPAADVSLPTAVCALPGLLAETATRPGAAAAAVLAAMLLQPPADTEHMPGSLGSCGTLLPLRCMLSLYSPRRRGSSVSVIVLAALQAAHYKQHGHVVKNLLGFVSQMQRTVCDKKRRGGLAGMQACSQHSRQLLSTKAALPNGLITTTKSSSYLAFTTPSASSTQQSSRRPAPLPAPPAAPLPASSAAVAAPNSHAAALLSTPSGASSTSCML